MGTSQSADASFTSAGQTQITTSIPDGYFGVQVINDVNGHKSAEEAYMRGRQEAAAELQASLGKVASQVYDNVNAQLESIDEMHMTAAKKAAEELKSKLADAQVRKNICSAEESAVVKCYHGHSSDLLACADFVKAYSDCALNSVTASLKK